MLVLLLFYGITSISFKPNGLLLCFWMCYLLLPVQLCSIVLQFRRLYAYYYREIKYSKNYSSSSNANQKNASHASEDGISPASDLCLRYLAKSVTVIIPTTSLP